MADAIFDASGNVAGNGGGGLSAWSGAGALASILPSATSGISTTLPSLFLSDGNSELSKAARATPRYTYPEAKKVDYGALAAQAAAEAAAAKNRNTSWDGGDIADLQNKLNAYNRATDVYNKLNKYHNPSAGMTDQQRGQYYDAVLAGKDPSSVLSPFQQRVLGSTVWH